ncbi:MAG: hypothetical protein KAI57_00645 [Candidatus Pacebacteria bacterium]|nr:hypothetical protein [Candidatus Paceibacterota bacterium]
MSFEKNILGNKKIINMLQKSYNTGKLSHAYLFEGPDHIGKKTFALEFCKLVLEDITDDIEKNSDLMILRPDEDKKQIAIEQIRNLEKKLSLSPYSSKHKISIIEKADMMTKAAANAILKTLEEPSKTTILILLTSNSGNLLDTIKSRCQIMKFLPVEKKILEDFLSVTIKDRLQRDKIIEMSGYKPGKIIEFAGDSDKIKEISNIIDGFSDVLFKNNSEKLDYVETISKKEPREIIDLLNHYSFYFRKKILEEIQNKDEVDKNKVLKIKNNIDLLNSVKKNILTKNINIKLALENLFLQI